MLQKLKDQALPIAILTGVLLRDSIAALAPFIPLLLFAMLLLAFCSVSPREMKVTRQHLRLLGIQLVLSALLYFALLPVNRTLAQGVFICALTPTAAGATAITGMLGGRVAFEASFVFLDNLVIAVLAPLFFTFFGDHPEIAFGESVLRISAQVFPILVLPLLLAWGLRRFVPAVHRRLLSVQGSVFYLWAAAIAVSAGIISKFVIEQENPDYFAEIGMAVLTLLLCLLQFRIGRALGRQHHNYVAAEQALGQKNTVLAIWMTQIYLNPIAAIGPGAYHLWQSCVNSYQLYLRSRKKRRRKYAVIPQE